jgi:glycosyltransferase involved in cell wall biosynthesis
MISKRLSGRKFNISQIMVSVVMPVYNTKSRYLKSAFKSIINQSHKNFEFIIIDDCSNNPETINELQDFKSYSQVILIRNKENVGIAYSLNTGITMAKGKYIFRMDSDDISTRNRLSNSIRFLEANNEVDIAGSNAFTFGKSIFPVFMPKTHESIIFHSLFFCPLIHPTVVFRSETVKKHSPLYKNIASEDYELWVRLQMTDQLKFVNIQKIHLLYRHHNNQLTNIKKEANSRIFLEYNNHLIEFYGLNFTPTKLINEFLDVKKLQSIFYHLKLSRDKHKKITLYFIYFFIKRKVKRPNIISYHEIKKLIKFYHSL